MEFHLKHKKKIVKRRTLTLTLYPYHVCLLATLLPYYWINIIWLLLRPTYAPKYGHRHSFCKRILASLLWVCRDGIKMSVACFFFSAGVWIFFDKCEMIWETLTLSREFQAKQFRTVISGWNVKIGLSSRFKMICCRLATSSFYSGIFKC